MLKKLGAFSYIVVLSIIVILISGCQEQVGLPPEPGSVDGDSPIGQATGIFEGYGTAFNVFETDGRREQKEIFALAGDINKEHFFTTPADVEFELPISIDLEDGYFWSIGMVFNHRTNKWQKIELTDSDEEKWIADGMDTTLEFSPNFFSEKERNFILVFACKQYYLDGGEWLPYAELTKDEKRSVTPEWKCGCNSPNDVCSHDSRARNGKWTLQYFEFKDLPDDPDDPGDPGHGGGDGPIFEGDLNDYTFISSSELEITSNTRTVPLIRSARNLNIKAQGNVDFDDALRKIYFGRYGYRGSSKILDMIVLEYGGKTERELRNDFLDLLETESTRPDFFYFFDEYEGVQYYTFVDGGFVNFAWAHENNIVIVSNDKVFEKRPLDILDGYLLNFLSPEELNLFTNEYCGNNICEEHEDYEITISEEDDNAAEEITAICSDCDITLGRPTSGCIEGDLKCSGDKLLQICVNGQFENEEICSGSCIVNRCVDLPSSGSRCIEGDLKCSGDKLLQKCVSGVFEDQETCTGSCIINRCINLPSGSGCIEGDLKCSGDKLLQKCVSGVFEDQETCTGSCIINRCVDLPSSTSSCAEGELKCADDKKLQKCVGGAFEDHQTCSGSCIINQCINLPSS